MQKIPFLALMLIVICCDAKISYQDLARRLNIPKIEAKRIFNTILIRKKIVEPSYTAYYDILPQFINSRNYETGCEIGLAFGGHIEWILKNTTVKKIYGMDPYVDYLGVAAAWKIKKKYWQTCWDALFYYVQDRLSPFGDRVEMIRQTATEGAILIPDNSLDFIFIDGDHSYAAVCQDISNYYDKVRSGGMIAGDDYNQEEVARAVNEFFTQKGLPINQHIEQERFWWVEKP